MEEHIVLGKTYRDEVTGYAGVATALGVYLHGPTRVRLESPVTAPGAAPTEFWCEENRLALHAMR